MRQWLGLVAGLAALGAEAGTVDFNRSYPLHLRGKTVQFRPANDHDLRRLSAEVASAIQGTNSESKHNRRGLEEIKRLASSALAATDPAERERLDLDLTETALAVNNNDRPTIPRRFDSFKLPVFLAQLYRPVGIGEKPATDLAPGTETDLSRRDPLPSSFWARPREIPNEDLAIGFGRSERPNFQEGVCRYAGPKESSGMNPGYEVDCDGDIVKLKFGEVSSEPLVARMFWALGFNADATDYAPSVKVAYDRRIFTEFNSRQPVKITFTALWFIPVYTLDLQGRADPFKYVAAAVLRDGQRWSGAELKQRLLAGTNFQPEVEAKIAYLVTAPANVQVKDPSVKSIGPWDYGQLDHADRRELRGAGLLAAWLGFYDTRFDNTKLRRVGPKKHPRVVHYFSDLGGGLGKTTGIMSWHGENVNEFPWTFTAPPLDHGKGRMARPLRIVGYTPVVRTPAFASMTIDDARWMARLIGQLRVPQISAALAASGYDAATTRLYTRKLVSRRNKMMADLGLSVEFPDLEVETAMSGVK